MGWEDPLEEGMATHSSVLVEYLWNAVEVMGICLLNLRSNRRLVWLK